MVINLLAVFIAAIASMILGFLWYSPKLFGEQWMKLVGMKKADSKKGNMGKDATLEFLKTLITAYILGLFMMLAGVNTLKGGIAIGFLAWLGFVGTISIGGIIWERRPKELYILNNAFNVISLMMMGAIIGAMP